MQEVEQLINWYVLSGVENFSADEPFDVLSPQNQALRPATSILAQSGNSAFINAKEICKNNLLN